MEYKGYLGSENLDRAPHTGLDQCCWCILVGEGICRSLLSAPQIGTLRARNFLRMYCVSWSTESTSTRMSLNVGRSSGLKARHLVPST